MNKKKISIFLSIILVILIIILWIKDNPYNPIIKYIKQGTKDSILFYKKTLNTIEQNKIKKKLYEEEIRQKTEYYNKYSKCKTGSNKSQLSCFINLEKKYPKDINILKEQVILNKKIGNNKEKIFELYKKIKNIDESNTGIIFNLGIISLKSGNYSDAINYFDEYLKYDNTNPIVFTNLGLSLYGEGKTKLAIKNYKKALELDRNNKTILYNLGLSYYNLGEFDNSYKFFHYSEKNGMTGNKINYYLGMLLFQQKNYNEAISYFQKELKQNKDVLIYKNLGITYIKTKEYEKSIKYFKPYIKKYSGDFEVWATIGNNYYKLGKFQQSYDSYQKSLNLKFDNTIKNNQLKAQAQINKI